MPEGPEPTVAKATRAPPSGARYLLALALTIFGTLYHLARQPESAAEPASAGFHGAPADLAAAAISGRVLVEIGEGEAVRVEPPTGACTATAWQAGRQVAASVPCAADGSFELPIEPGVEGLVTCELLVPGALRAALDLEVTAGSHHRLSDVVLGPAQALLGRVVDARERPVADATVSAMPIPDLGEREPWRVRTDADGLFRIDTLPAGPVALRGAKEGYVDSATEAVAPGAEVVLVLGEMFDLGGEVVGPPEAFERVRLRLEGSAVWPPIEEPVDPEGRFVFAGLPDGVYGLEAVAPATRPGEPEYASVPLENVTPDLYVTLALVPAHRVAVRVFDRRGSAIPGARVTVGHGSVGLLKRLSRAGADGRAAVGPLTPGRYVVGADADGYLPSAPIEVAVPAAGEIAIVLARPGRIEGVVVDDGDHEVAGAEIWVDGDEPISRGEADSRAEVFDNTLLDGGMLGVTSGPVPPIPMFAGGDVSWLSPISDDDGRFVIDNLVPGTYRLRAADGRHAASATVTVELASGEIRGGVRLVLRAGFPLAGRVLDGNAQPLSGVTIDLDDGTTLISDERGVFDAGTRRGRVRVVAHRPGMIPWVSEVNLDGRGVELEIRLEPADGVLEGRVLDGNARPLSDVQVLVEPADGVSPTAIAYTDERGTFSFDALVPGAVVVELDHPDHPPRRIEARVRAGSAGAPLEVVFGEGGTLEVLVREARSGDPIRGARVEVLAGDVVAASTGRDGRASVHRLEGAHARVRVSAPGFVARTLEVSLGETPLVELEEGGRLEGIATDDRGDPLVDGRVRVVSRGGAMLARTGTAADGTFVVDDLPEGDVVVWIDPPSELAAELAPTSVATDVLRGKVTRGVQVRLDRR